jgi:hypothetical protein
VTSGLVMVGARILGSNLGFVFGSSAI